MKGRIAIALLGAGAVLLVAQSRMNYSLVSQESGHAGAGAGVAKVDGVRHLPAGAGASG